jgi:hypothetical protein
MKNLFENEAEVTIIFFFCARWVRMILDPSKFAWIQIYSCDAPPSTGSSAPVVYVASNARYATALATSSG